MARSRRLLLVQPSPGLKPRTGLHHCTARSFTRITCTGPTALLSRDNIHQAWKRTCQRHPLLNSRCDLADDKQFGYLTLSEDTWHVGSDVLFTEQTEQEISDRLLGPEAQLVEIFARERLSRLIIAPCSATSSDDKTKLEVIVCLDHVIADLISYLNILRTFFQELASPDTSLLDMRTQLARCVSMDSTMPFLRMPLSRRRWRRATALIIAERRSRRVRGGKTLPVLRLPKTEDISCSRRITRSISEQRTQLMTAYVRNSGIAFHHHYCVCAQVALMRTLYKLQSTAKLFASEADFQQCLLEPFHHGSPLNLRALLGYDQTAVAVCLGFDSTTFPAIVARHVRVGEVPTHAQLLSRQRYLGRVRLSSRLMLDFTNHPLFFEMQQLHIERFISHRPQSTHPTSVEKDIDRPPVTAFTGGSLGIIDRYLPSTFGNGEIQLTNSSSGLRSRPGELYVAVQIWQGRLVISGTVDAATYDDEVIDLFWDEIVIAMEHYLVPSD